MEILVLGGTAWLGRIKATEALARGHEVSCLARGERGDVVQGARLIVADRAHPDVYLAVQDRDWDAVVEVSWQPRFVQEAVDALAARARHWVYVSSVSVYADTDVVDADESARLLAPLQADIADRAVYGEAKVAGELVGLRVQLRQVDRPVPDRRGDQRVQDAAGGRGAGVPAPALGCGSVLVRHSGVGHSVLVTHALVTFIVAASLLVVLPGPDSLLVVRSIMLKGRRAAVTTTAGVLSGLAVWVAAAALGLAALLHASHVGYTALRIVGAVYLVTLGVQALRSAQRPAASVDRDRGPGVLGVGYRAGLVTNLLNPKIGVFFVTFLPGFVPAGAPVGPTSLLLGAVFVAEGALYFTVLILLAERLTGVLRRPVVRRRMDRLAGVVLIGFGARLLAES